MPKALDGIRIKKSLKRVSPPSPILKKFNWKILVFVFVFLGLISGSIYAIQAVSPKLDVLRLFRSGKYLIIFQNNAELRPTGGFIGSFAVATFSNYKLQDLNFNTNIYKLDKSFSENHIISPPGPLEDITAGKWTLRDSNWAVSFPQSAQKISWFYNQETGQNVDGVIAVNASVVRDLLKITGPITLSKYNTTISYDNFFTELTTQIEQEYYDTKTNKIENEPKTILKNLAPEIFQRLKNHKLEVLKLVYRELSEKQILLNSENLDIEKGILAENWGGEVASVSKDYLMVNQANISDISYKSGGKSSVSVQEKIDYKVTKQNGVLVGNLTVIRSHTGSGKWPDGTNRNWTRILVPQGSELQTATLDGKDFAEDISKNIESGKTTFAFWIKTAPKTSTVVNLTYILPFSERNYTLLVQKQPGNLGDNFVATFENKVLFDGILNSDKAIK